MIRALITAAVLALSTLTASAAPDNATGLPYTPVDGLQGRHLYNGHMGDPEMGYALHVIRSNYGHVVDVITKGKPLAKYGKTLNADQNVKTTVMTLPGAEANETFVSTNTIDSISSSSGSDTGPLVVEGHTCDQTTGDKTFVVQTATLTGQTEATLPTPLCRSTRAYRPNGTFASPTVNLVGTIYVYDNTGVTLASGVPNVNANVHLMIEAGENQSEKAATSLSSTDYWIVHQVAISIGRASGATANVDVEIEVREQGGVWRSLGGEYTLRSGSDSGVTFDFEPYAIIKPNSDVRLVATSSVNDTIVSGFIAGWLGQIVDTIQ